MHYRHAHETDFISPGGLFSHGNGRSAQRKLRTYFGPTYPKPDTSDLNSRLHLSSWRMAMRWSISGCSHRQPFDQRHRAVLFDRVLSERFMV
jgi:hypothetical protein